MRKGSEACLIHAIRTISRVVEGGNFPSAVEQMHLATAQISWLVQRRDAWQ